MLNLDPTLYIDFSFTSFIWKFSDKNALARKPAHYPKPWRFSETPKVPRFTSFFCSTFDACKFLVVGYFYQLTVNYSEQTKVFAQHKTHVY